MKKEKKLSDSLLVAEKRDVSGTSASRRLRHAGIVPAVISDEEGAAHTIQLSAHELTMLLQHHRSESLILDIKIDGDQNKKVLLKEVQHHPVNGKILHADFVEVSMTKKMRVNVEIELVGDPVGVIKDGGVLDHLLRDISVECLPGDLLESIKVDVTNLELGHTLSVKDIKVDSKITILTDGDIAIAAVAAPKVEEEKAEEVEEGAEGAEAAPATEGGDAKEPEVIGEKKEEKAAENK
jgi:large subunit ribosomal protein L25